jgi:hypothetical protein
VPASIVVSFVRAAAVFNGVDVQHLLVVIALGTETKLSDSQFEYGAPVSGSR